MKATNKRFGEKSFAVLGSGICGITVGNMLLERYPDAKVTLYTDNALSIVSFVAGAQFYPIWLGDHLPTGTDALLRKWFLASKKIFTEHSRVGMGVYHMRNHELFEKETPPPAYFYDVLSNLEVAADPRLPAGYTHRYSFDTMIINPLIYHPLLAEQFKVKGGTVTVKRFDSLEDVLQLGEKTIFNCLGMGAKHIFGDQFLNRVKGLMLRMKPIPGLRESISVDDLLIAPRGDEVYLGAPYLTSWDTDYPTEEEQTTLLARHKELLETPGSRFSLPKGTLKKENCIGALAGFRPVRDLGPRVEKEHIGGKTIVHNYGHGGNGVVLSWGTAQHALELL
jgi:hypothetical protein